jgi:hypothetical protein
VVDADGRFAVAKASEQGFARNHAKGMLKLMAAGACVFLLLLVALQVALSFAGNPVDSTFYKFYPIMAALGAVFGFERWGGKNRESTILSTPVELVEN